MKKTVYFIDNILEPKKGRPVKTVDICKLLKRRFKGKWREGTRIYHKEWVESCNVTPLDAADYAALNKLPGPFYVVAEPHGGWELIAIGVLSLLASAASFLFAPKPKVPGNQSAQSANNDLAQRQNKARPLQRIPDIFGKRRSWPDLLSAPYRVFEGADEIEHWFGGIGRGAYEIPTNEIREDKALISEIDGASVEIYDPFTSPNSGDEPAILVGDRITDDFLDVRASGAINGQTLEAPNQKKIVGHSNMVFYYPNIIVPYGDDPRSYFEADDIVDILDASDDDGHGHSVDLAGTGYTVDHVDSRRIFLSSPASINSDWTTLGSFPDDHTSSLSSTIQISGIHDPVVGPITLERIGNAQVLCTFVAMSGLYKNDGESQSGTAVDIKVTITPVNEAGTAIGPAETFTDTISGSSTSQSRVGLTMFMQPTFAGRCTVKAERLTEHDYAFHGTVVDEVKWRDLALCYAIEPEDFGNVTTVRTRQISTPAALAQKDRKLNMLVTRKIPERDPETNTFGTELVASTNVADILCFAALDPYIGRRSISELDVAQIYEEIDKVVDYFGSEAAIQFGHTFDDDNMSFEEMAEIIAQSAFCVAYRRGSLIQLHFEKRTDDSALLFNHRNILPGSQTRTARFGNVEDFDGVEVTYYDADNFDAPATYRIPVDGSAQRPQKIEFVGPITFSQIYWLAWRAYQKILHQHFTTEFIATSEAELLPRMERILVARQNRATMDGEVLAQDGLVLTLSQEVTFEVGKNYLIFLQLPDATVQAIGVSEGEETNEVILDEPPASSLSLDSDNVARAKYWIVADDDVREQAFLVSEVEPEDMFTNRVSGVNYSDQYYSADQDLNWINEAGERLLNEDGDALQVL